MYKELFALARRPSLWQRSAEPFWDDPHISAMMLKAHLDPNTDAASRRDDVIERSVSWLCTRMPPFGKILDLGCGPGLYTKRFSGLGYDVTGIDLSKSSIGYAKDTDKKTRYILGDYLALESGPEYDAVTLIYCDYAALTKQERMALLHNIRRMLKPGGVFIFDVFSQASYNGKSESSSWHFYENGGFWSAQPYICLKSTCLYEGNTVSADHYVVVAGDGIKQYIIWDTAYTKRRLTDEIESAGLRVKEVLGDICGREYSDDSQTLCCVAAKQSE